MRKILILLIITITVLSLSTVVYSENISTPPADKSASADDTAPTSPAAKPTKKTKKAKSINNSKQKSITIFKNSAYGDLIKGESLYATISKNGDNYTIESISPQEGNVLLNDLSPAFNTAERKCGNYYANGTPVDADAIACEARKKSEFISVTVNTVSNLFKTAFSLGTNVIAGGQHLRSGKFDDAEYKLAIEQVFEKGQVNRKVLIDNYTYFITHEKEILTAYKSNVENIKIKFNINDATGFYKGLNLNSYVVDHCLIPVKTSISKFTHQEFLSFFERQNADKYLADKYSKINFEGYSGTVSDFKLTLDPSVADNKEVPLINVNANINDKSFVNIYPGYVNEDNYIKTEFDGKNILFTNKTDNFVLVLSVSLYYGTYIKTLKLSDNPIELAPLATTLDPISLAKFEDQKIKQLSTYESITATKAKATTLNFGFAIKYRVVEQNMDKTQFKINKHNLYELLASQTSVTSESNVITEISKPKAKQAKRR